MKIIKNLFFLVTFLTLCPTFIYANGGHEEKTVLDSIQVEGTWRTFEYHVPQFPAENSRLIVVLHGDGMTAKSIQTITGYEFNKQADKNGSTIIVYPQGYKNYWNDCRKKASFETKKKNLNDVVFIKSLVQRMQRRYDIDYKNVFAVGYFNGGHMCFKLARSIPGVFKGFAVIGANLPINTNDTCTSIGEPISLLVISDTADQMNPYEGGENVLLDGFTRGQVMSTDETMGYWLKLSSNARAIPKPIRTNTIEKDNSVAVGYDYFSEESNKRISLLKIVKGGYPFPNPLFRQWPQMEGNVEKHLNIPETVVRFFYQVQYEKPFK